MTVAVVPDTVAETAEMAGATVSGVVKVAGAAGAAGEVLELPAASAEVTRKWYCVVESKPVMITECEVPLRLVAVDVREPADVP